MNLELTKELANNGDTYAAYLVAAKEERDQDFRNVADECIETEKVTKEFWKLWRYDKITFKALGYGVHKVDGSWKVWKINIDFPKSELMEQVDENGRPTSKFWRYWNASKTRIKEEMDVKVTKGESGFIVIDEEAARAAIDEAFNKLDGEGTW